VKNLVDVRSPDEYAGRLLRPPTCRRSRRSAPAHPDGCERARGARRPTTTAPSSPTTSSAALHRAGVDWSKDTIAYCRIGERSSHTWFVFHELLDRPTSRTTTAPWTEYGSLVGVPVVLGDDAGEADA
jgi:thiosulfate/3-mercaptopyruvate sulfurtransferase